MDAYESGASYIYLSGSTPLATAKGEVDGPAWGYSYGVTSTMAGTYYPDNPTSGPQQAATVFAFVKNTGTESGTHVAHVGFLAPHGQTFASASGGPFDYAMSLAGVVTEGSVTLDSINGVPVQ